MATKRQDTEEHGPSGDDPRAAIAAARAEVVDILAGAIFTLLLEGRMPPARDDEQEQLGECS